MTHPDRYWREALDRPAARQVRHLRTLMESRPYLTRIPDQGMLVGDAGGGGEHIQATRDEQGRYSFIYFPVPRPADLRLNRLRGDQVMAHWYDSRAGV